MKQISSYISDIEFKQKQLDIVLKYNPMLDDYHTGIRTIKDIKTWQECFDDIDEDGGFSYPDNNVKNS